MKLLKSGLFALCLSVLALSPVFALEVPKRAANYVTDQADLLSPQTEQKLELALRQYETKTSNQVVIVTFPSLEGESLEDFSIRLAEQWKVGQKGRDNGVIFLIFRDDRKLRIEVGYGLEGAIPDALAGQIISQAVVPYFKVGEYEKGILAGTAAIVQAAEGEFKGVGYTRGRVRRQPMTAEQATGLLIAVSIIVLVLFVMDMFRFRGYGKEHKLYQDRYSFWEWWFRFGLLLIVLSILFRVLFYSMLFSRGGYYGSRGGFGGGFSGGGGGFGGGGASGGW